MSDELLTKILNHIPLTAKEWNKIMNDKDLLMEYPLPAFHALFVGNEGATND